MTSRAISLRRCVNFDREQCQYAAFTFEQARAASEKAWCGYWESGAAIDFSECTDQRAGELERRVVLSQYLTAIHCAGSLPSQETGLLCNSWYGKFHLEMHWWHSVHFAAWGREGLFERSLGIYAQWLGAARELAASQGFAGARWPKMVGPDGKDSPVDDWAAVDLAAAASDLLCGDVLSGDRRRRRRCRSGGRLWWRRRSLWRRMRRWMRRGGEYVLGPALRTVSENNDDRAINPT